MRRQSLQPPEAPPAARHVHAACGAHSVQPASPPALGGRPDQKATPIENLLNRPSNRRHFRIVKHGLIPAIHATAHQPLIPGTLRRSATARVT